MSFGKLKHHIISSHNIQLDSVAESTCSNGISDDRLLFGDECCDTSELAPEDSELDLQLSFMTFITQLSSKGNITNKNIQTVV